MQIKPDDLIIGDKKDISSKLSGELLEEAEMLLTKMVDDVWERGGQLAATLSDNSHEVYAYRVGPHSVCYGVNNMRKNIWRRKMIY